MTNHKLSSIVSKVPLSEQLSDKKVSSLTRYRQKVIGNKGLASLLHYEMIQMVSANMQGGLGYLFRKKMFGPLLKHAGPGMILGRGITLRHPDHISLGSDVAVDDNVLLDAGGAGEEGVVLGDGVIVSRNCLIQGKSGPVFIGARSDIGSNTVITSVSGIHIGEGVLIAANCYLGGAQYVTYRLDIPVMDQGVFRKNPLQVGDGAWLGAGVIVLDGVSIGKGCIVGAGAVVVKDIPDNVIAVGAPARVLRSRGHDN